MSRLARALPKDESHCSSLMCYTTWMSRSKMRSCTNSKRGQITAPVIVSFVLIAVSIVAIRWISRPTGAPSKLNGELIVYCAAGIRPAVEPILQEYESEYGAKTSLQLGPSGGLEAQIRLSDRGDLFVPAAVDPFLKRLRADSLVDEILPVAELRLVIAVSPNAEKIPASLAELMDGGFSFGLCNEQAAAGQRTKKALARVGLWDRVFSAAKATLPTVTELAEAIRDGGKLDAGITWSTTAKQFELQHVEVPELAHSRATVGVGVLGTTHDPTAALRLARYLAAKDRGQLFFQQHHYDALPGDPWIETPRLTLYSGTVNRHAIKDSLREFETREGCEIATVFDGCGTLVGMMKTGTDPDAYFACDVSYVEQVSERFLEAVEISENPLVILVREGNPMNIESLEDLSREDVVVGLCDPDLSALGSLTRRLLREEGVYQQSVRSGAITVTTGDLLVAQMLAGDKLDAVVVYRANCVKALDELELVRIDHPLAMAIQPFSVHREAAYPQLTARLCDYLTSGQSRDRFEKWGFRWRANRTGIRNGSKTNMGL